MSESKLSFYSLNTKFENSNSFMVHSFTSEGKMESYYCKYENIVDVLIYIKQRYLDQSKELKTRNIKIKKIDDTSINLLQKSTYENFVSHKNYIIYNTSMDEIEKFLEMFNDTKFK